LLKVFIHFNPLRYSYLNIKQTNEWIIFYWKRSLNFELSKPFILFNANILSVKTTITSNDESEFHLLECFACRSSHIHIFFWVIILKNWKHFPINLSLKWMCCRFKNPKSVEFCWKYLFLKLSLFSKACIFKNCFVWCAGMQKLLYNSFVLWLSNIEMVVK